MKQNTLSTSTLGTVWGKIAQFAFARLLSQAEALSYQPKQIYLRQFVQNI